MMWRPLIDVKDVARAYVMAVEADADLISGQVFNLTAQNWRISELALAVQRALRDLGIHAEVEADFSYRLVRSYRVSGEKLMRTLGFRPRVTIEESVATLVEEINRYEYTDFDNPRYYNIAWFKLLEEAVEIAKTHGYVLSKPEWTDADSVAAGLGRPSPDRTR
jgi:hypothetical protein